MMHPTRADLIDYLYADSTKRQQFSRIANHLEKCGECQSAMARLESWREGIDDSVRQGLPPVAEQLAERLFTDAQKAMRVINLRPWGGKSPGTNDRLAADGERDEIRPGEIENLATLYSEDPEIILRVMRDLSTGEESLHLISAKEEQTANVLIRIIEPQMDFVTDARGTVRLGDQQLDNLAELLWQVRLPDAVFNLKSLAADFDQSTAKKQYELEADQDNRVRVELASRDEGIMLTLTLLRIGGQEKLTSARVVITQAPTDVHSTTVQTDRACTITGLRPTDPICIRIFAG